MIHGTPRSDRQNRLKHIWHRLTEPPPTVTEPDARRQARLISALLLCVVVLGVYGSVVEELMRPAHQAFRTPSFYLTLLSVGLVISVYVLSRTRHYQWAAVSLIIVCAIGPFGLALSESGQTVDKRILAYLVLPLVLSSLLLSLRATTILAGVQLLGVIVFAQVFDVTGIGSMLVFLSMLSVVIVYGAHHRNLIEQDRQANLRDAEDRYRRLVELAPFTISIQHKGEIAYINPAGVALLGGASASDFVGQSTIQFVHPDDMDAARARIARTYDPNREVVRVEEKLIGLDGRVVDVETTVLPFWFQGEPAAQIIVRDLTEQKRAEAERRTSEAQYRDLVENLPLGVYRTEPGQDGRVLVANPAFLAIFGIESEADLQSIRVADLYVNPAERLDFSNMLLAAGSVTDVELYLKRLDGVPLWGSVTARVVRDPDAQVTYFDCVLIDITMRKQAESAIRRNQAHLGALLSAIPDLIFQLDRDGIFTSFHAPDHGTLMPPEEFLGKPIRDVLPNLADQTLDNIRRALATGDLQTFEYQLMMDGELRDYEARMSACAEDEVVVVVRDITDWKLATEHLQRERDRAQQYLDTAGVILVVLDVEGRVTLINRKGREILGYDEEELLGQFWFDVCLPEREREAVYEYFKRTIVGEAELPADFQNAIRTRAGEERLVAWHNTLLRDAAGQVIGTLSSGEDITERRRAQAELFESQARYLALINASPNSILVVRDGRYIFANLAGARMLGYDEPDDVIGVSALTTFAPAWRETVRERLNRLEDGEPNSPIEMDVMRRDGSTLTVESTSVPIMLRGEPAALIIGQDITERKQVEQAEHEARALAEALRDTAAALTQTLEKDEVVERILANLGQVIPHDAAGIMLMVGEKAVSVRHHGYAAFDAGDTVDAIELTAAEFPLFRKVLETQRVQIIADTRTDERWQRLPKTDWIRSHITVPILSSGQVIGIINLDSATPNAFTPDHASRTSIFANQAAVAIRNAELYSEVQQYAAQLEALHQTMLDVAAQIELDVLLNKLVENAIALIGAQAGGIYLARPDRDVLEWAVQVGEPEALTPIGTEIRRGEGVAGKVWETREPLIVDDYASWEGRSPQYEHLHFSAVIGVPIIWDKQLLGVFNAVADADERTFSQQDARLLHLFVNQAAIALQKARMFDELEHRVRERTVDLRVRNRVAATLSRSLDRDEILYGVLETTVEQLSVAGGAIFLLAGAVDQLDLAASYSMSDEVLAWVSDILPGVSSLTQGTSSSFSTVDMPQNGAMMAVLWVPIWRQDQVEGVIVLVNEQTRPWRGADTRMLDAIGRQIAVALHNAHLYEQAVRDEARIRTIVHSVADGLLVFDQSGTLMLMNPAAEALFAFYPDECGGSTQAALNLWEWLRAQGDTQTAEFALPIVSLVSAGGLALSDQCHAGCIFRDGGGDSDAAWPCWLLPGGPTADDLALCPVFQKVSTCSLQANSAEVRDAEGQVLGRVIALRDVTYFRELDELKGMFVSTVSHELRTPLSVVLLQVSTLLRYYDRLSDDERRRMIGEVQAQAHILRELIEDILELSRYDAKRSLPEKQWFDLVALCHDVFESLEPAIREKALAVDLARCVGLRYIYADPNQIMRALRNLVGNAVKYTPSGGQIGVALSEVDDMVKIEVSDTGIGIVPEEQFAIFDRFFRSEHAAHMAPGTGLGLSITQEIIDLHHGRIDLASQPGVGTTFTVLLPIGSEE